ncbi:hypothetical protein DFH11DRAFT_1542594 [Phellopilus nigrolimitatus]|nr:hypothetical protein DFH11DRAFT_1542594 [Phellopilus nigrolimitatus]
MLRFNIVLRLPATRGGGGGGGDKKLETDFSISATSASDSRPAHSYHMSSPLKLVTSNAIIAPSAFMSHAGESSASSGATELLLKTSNIERKTKSAINTSITLSAPPGFAIHSLTSNAPNTFLFCAHSPSVPLTLTLKTANAHARAALHPGPRGRVRATADRRRRDSDEQQGASRNRPDPVFRLRGTVLRTKDGCDARTDMLFYRDPEEVKKQGTRTGKVVVELDGDGDAFDGKPAYMWKVSEALDYLPALLEGLHPLFKSCVLPLARLLVHQFLLLSSVIRALLGVRGMRARPEQPVLLELGDAALHGGVLRLALVPGVLGSDVVRKFEVSEIEQGSERAIQSSSGTPEGDDDGDDVEAKDDVSSSALIRAPNRVIICFAALMPTLWLEGKDKRAPGSGIFSNFAYR